MSMVVACAGYQDGRRVADLDVAECGSFPDNPARFVWVGLYEPSEELLRVLQRQFGLHDLAVEDAFRAHQRPKLDVYGDGVFMVLRTARLVETGIEFGRRTSSPARATSSQSDTAPRPRTRGCARAASRRRGC